MRSLYLIVATGLISSPVSAQSDPLNSGRTLLEQQRPAEAVPVLERAVAAAKGPGSPEANFLLGSALMQKSVAAKAPSAADLDRSEQAYRTALTLQIGYPEFTNQLYTLAVLYYNLGVDRYEKKDFTGVFPVFDHITALAALERSRKSGNDAAFDRLEASARTTTAYAAVNAGAPARARPLLEQMLRDGAADSSVYAALVTVYSDLAEDAALLRTLEAARRLYPASSFFRLSRLKYYLSGKTEERVLVAALEEAVEATPNDAALWHNLGSVFFRRALRAPSAGTALVLDQAAFDKAVEAFSKATAMAPTVAAYQYSAGALHYQLAVYYTQQMGLLSAIPAPEDPAWQKMNALRNAALAMALPLLERTDSLLWAGKSPTGDPALTRSVLTALREIYSRTGVTEKQAAVDARLKALR